MRQLLEPRKRSTIRQCAWMGFDSINSMYIESEIDRLVNEKVKKLKGDLAHAEMTVVGLRNKVVEVG